MKLEELDLQATDLWKRFSGINNWIQNNLNTDPNFSEIVDCTVEYGKLVRKYADYFEENGYPVIQNKGRNATKFEIAEVSQRVRVAQEELRRMLSLRGNSPFFKDKIVNDFMEDLCYRTATAEYENVNDEQISNMKKDILCQLAAIYFYIWQTKQKEPEYLYDNISEWNAFKEKYEAYKSAVGVQESITSEDGMSYEGPQFGRVIEEMMAGVEKNSIFNKEVSMEEEENNSLKLQASNLKSRFEGINGWIEANPNTNPNFCEMVDCVVEYGKLVSQYDSYYKNNGYPILENEGREATQYEIAVVAPEVREVQEELYKMMQLRGTHNFFGDSVARGYMNELAYDAAIGKYDIPEDNQIAELKKYILCQVAAVYFYIWDTKQREPNYKYDNVSEWTILNEKYALYRELVGVQEYRENEDGSTYQGPQFGSNIEELLAEIEKDYLYNISKEAGTYK